MTKFRPSSRQVLAACSILALTGGAVVYAGNLTSASSSTGTISSVTQAESSQLSQVRAAFVRAVETDQSFGNPPASYAAGIASTIRAGKPAPTIPADMRKQIFATQRRALLISFTGIQAKHELSYLADNIALDANPNILNLGAGVSKIKIKKIAIAGSRATVEADVTVWAKSYARQSSHSAWLYAAPVNVVDDVATLTINSLGRWRVSSLTGNFVPGYGP